MDYICLKYPHSKIMDLRLSWDLFVVVFFVIITAYSLIIGKDNTVKVIIGTYISLVCADAIGELIGHYFMGTEMFVLMTKEARLESTAEALIFLKVLMFVILIILFAVRGAFSVGTSRGNGASSLLLHLFYAACSAGLIVSTILILISGVSVVGGGGTVSEALKSLSQQSVMVNNIVYYHKFFFAVPAVAFLVHSFLSEKME